MGMVCKVGGGECPSNPELFWGDYLVGKGAGSTPCGPNPQSNIGRLL